MTGINQKVFSRSFHSFWDCENRWRIDGDMAKWSLWQTHKIPNSLLQAEQYNIDKMATLVNEQRAIFNFDQAAAFDAVLESVTNNQGHLFFIHAASSYRKTVTNFIWPYLHQFFNDSHSLRSYEKTLKRPFDRYQSCLEAINIGWDIKQINR